MKLNFVPLAACEKLASICAITAFTFSTSLTIAQIYKSVDANGNVTYSDTPSKNAKVMDIKPINTAPAQPVKTTQRNSDNQPTVSSSETKNDSDSAINYQQLRITSPKNEAYLANGLAGLTVMTTIKPQLDAAHQLRLLINDQPRSLSSSNRFELERVNRGQQHLKVQIIDESGKVLKTSPSVKIFVQWPGGNKAG